MTKEQYLSLPPVQQKLLGIIAEQETAARHALITREFVPRGAVAKLFRSTESKIIVSGPAGTGKSRGVLEHIYSLCRRYKNVRALMVRKTRKSLTQSGMVTFDQRVLPAHKDKSTRFHAGDQEYRFPATDSIMAAGGIDDADKIMSTEWDLIYVQEATELTQDDWLALSSRLRNWKLTWQQIIGDCNPGPPTHWIKQQAEAGGLTMLESRHEDNPELFNEDGTMTPHGREYIEGVLDKLGGVRYKRLRLGQWVAAEGQVYENWDDAIHRIERFDIPLSWPRYWVIDFGYTNPFFWAAAAEDPDGRLYVYKQIYKTQTIVEDHVKRIKEIVVGDVVPRAIICDHDAEDRATFERHMGLRTVSAWKDVSPGIQAVIQRLRVAGDGKPRLMFMRESLDERDKDLMEKYKPCSFEEEVAGYVWDTRNGRKLYEEPIKENDHGCDGIRYLVAFKDAQPKRPRVGLRNLAS